MNLRESCMICNLITPNSLPLSRFSYPWLPSGLAAIPVRNAYLGLFRLAHHLPRRFVGIVVC